MKDPLCISYDNVIQVLERHLDHMKKTYPGRVTAGSLGWWSARHQIAVFTLVVKMVKKHKRRPQLDFNAVFDKVQRVKDVPEIPVGMAVPVSEDPDLYITPE